ncbi:MAG: FKBP-type peptidyl-prolyl cis-trans isomerase [Actinomycetota bacterium]|nr:FKBP-type peptidyl-prolyl cis-trans isomerase [Actinomycetota bacterium]MDA2973673.1 FKBP-type peptidyl-prolyl cis-trans isomerase [Actinomycetota bacterium]MDA3009423.1 FKBP-type peptidyl-prolyl cis-trans isomerase [Actinomycetota bacterium]
MLPRLRPTRLSLAALLLITMTGACGSDDAGVDESDVTDVELSPVDADAPTTTIGENPLDVEPLDEAPTELLITDIEIGTGREATPGDSVWVDYVGVITLTGELFDTSLARGQALNFTVGAGQVIQGWDDGLLGATPGAKRRLDIPADLAYGDNPPGDPIKAGDALTFIVDVRAVVPPTRPEDAPLDIDTAPSDGALELSIEDLVEGDGHTAVTGDTVLAHLLLVRGDNRVTLFNTWDRGEPLEILLEDGYTLPGLQQGITGMSVGGTRILKMPPDLAFGPDGEPGLGLPAGRDLIAIVELVGAW